MTLLKGQQLTAGAHIIVPSAKFAATAAPKNVAGAPIRDAAGAAIASGSSASDAGQTGVVPNLYYTNQLSNKLSVGLGINAPFGLTTEYDKSWVGRYHAVESSVATININPNIASLAAASSPAANLALAADSTNLSNPANDILVENTADDWSYGYNLGLLYQFNEATRVGVSHRFEIEHKVTGEVISDVPASVANLDAAGLFADQSINAAITLPALASISIFHQMNDRLALLADVSWTGWSSFDKLVVNFEGTGIAAKPNSATTENWDDSWRYSIGATLRATDTLVLRTGLAYDETPITDEYRTPRIPCGNRIWLFLGAGYQLSQNLNLDIAYAHLFMPDSKFNKTATPGSEDEGRGTVQGEFENSVDIVSAQLSWLLQ